MLECIDTMELVLLMQDILCHWFCKKQGDFLLEEGKGLVNILQCSATTTEGQIKNNFKVFDKCKNFLLEISKYKYKYEYSKKVFKYSINTNTHVFDPDPGLQVVDSSSLVSILFSEVVSHPYISFFHLLVNVFSVIIIII